MNFKKSNSVSKSDMDGKGFSIKLNKVPQVKSAIGSNQSDMRAYNKKLILTLIRTLKAASKTEIAGLTGLTAQTISVIMRELEETGYLKSETPIRGKVGQPSVPKSLDKDGAYFLGLTIKRKNTVLTLIDFLGDVIDIYTLDYEYPEAESILNFALEKIYELKESLGDFKWSKVRGLGIATPFHMWEWAEKLGVSSEQLSSWKTFNMKDKLSEYLDMPIYIENDASSACNAELILGGDYGYENALYFYIDYFIGGGIILNGYVMPGNAGVIGPALVPDKSGNIKQLVDIASLNNLASFLRSDENPFRGFSENPENWNINYKDTEPWIEESSNAIAHAIVSAYAIFDFDKTILDGWLPAELKKNLIKRTKLKVSELEKAGLNEINICPGKVGHMAGYMGAALLPLFHDYMLDRRTAMKF